MKTAQKKIKNRVVSYWGKRSESFFLQRKEEIHDDIAERWMREIRTKLPADRVHKILDVGCGSGFFSILLAKEGYEVTGIDLTPEMIEKSKMLALEEEAKADFICMDAEQLDFADESFDMVVSRNLTWTLPHGEKAYAEWMRVLKPGGVLLNFDADYGASLERYKSVELPENHAHNMISDELKDENDAITRLMPVSMKARPIWDVKVLRQCSASSLDIDFEISERIYKKRDEFYNPVPMFMITARKRG